MGKTFGKLIVVGLATMGLLVMGAMVSMAADTQKNPWEVWDYSKEKPVRGGYYRTAGSVDVGLLNPNHWPVLDWIVINFFFEKMLITDGSYRPIPWMVESWDYPDPLTCIMKLTEGIKFSDGTDYNAESVKYLIDWIKEPKNGAWSSGWIKPIKSVEVVDTYTLKWNFTQEWAAFLGIIANVPGYMISKKALEGDVALKALDKTEAALKKEKAGLAKLEKAGTDDKGKAKLAESRKNIADLEAQVATMREQAEGAKDADKFPVGTGQWLLEERSSGNFIKVKRNPDWWYGKKVGHPDMPYYDGRIQTIIPDPSVRLANLRAGKIDNMGLTGSQYDQIMNDKSLQLFVSPLNWVTAFSYNHVTGPCQDIRVRKAISHAIDRKALIVGTQFGLGRIASCMYPEDHWTHNPNLKPVTFDPELSKKLLAEAGYKDGLTVKGYYGDSTGAMNIAEAVKAMLEKVGIKWEVDFLQAAAASDRGKNLEFDFAGGGWSWIYDPDLMASGLYHPTGGFNYGRTKNEEAVALIEAGRKEVDLEKRKLIYYKLEEVLYNNYEDAWLWWGMSASAYRPKVRGINHPMSIKYKEVWSWSHPTWFKDGKE
jgi:ABC-type transport system substrate-binding protein